MRARSGWTLPAVLVAGFALVLPTSSALGTPAGAPAPGGAPTVTAPSARPNAAAVPGLSASRLAAVTLPTGQRVRLVGRRGHEQVLLSHRGPAGPGTALVTRRLGTHVYVTPAVADPYLGRFLDPSLFDVARRSTAASRSGRIAVRIAYRGSVPAVPGVRLTSAASGVARGYLTTRSADSFGRALTAQWRADSRAGWPQRSTLFPGVTRITADGPGSIVVKPAYPMYTLVLKAIGPDGKPQQFGTVALLNVDHGSRFAGFAFVENGEARVSVPRGHYGAIADNFVYDEKADTGALWIAVVNEYRVTGAGQTITLDYRKATAHPTATVPRPTTLLDYSLEWDRVDAADEASFASRYDLGADIDLRLTPTANTTIGTTRYTHNFVLAARDKAVNPDTYTLGVNSRRVPANPHFTFRSTQFGVVHSTYYGDGATKTGGFLRFPEYPTSLFVGGSFDPVTRGALRTEYVATNTPAVWTDAALLNLDAFDDPGFMDGPTRAIPAGHTTSARWFRGPLAPTVPRQQGPGFCYTCRSGNHVLVALAPYTDSDPNHLGYLFGAEDGLPVARFRFYRNAKLVSDQDDSLGGRFAVSRRKATYRAVLDVDRRLQEPAQSTQTRTELTFSSAKGKGKKLPGSWYCEGSSCRVLPLLQARVALPTNLKGQLPAARSTVTVVVAPVQNSARSAITRARLEIRPAGWSWSSVRLTAVGGGRYSGVVNMRHFAGSAVDLRVSAADKAGSTFRQTIVRAYGVSPS